MEVNNDDLKIAKALIKKLIKICTERLRITHIVADVNAKFEKFLTSEGFTGNQNLIELFIK